MTTQAQYSLTDQLEEMRDLAVKGGLYDAVDWLDRTVDRQVRRVPSTSAFGICADCDVNKLVDAGPCPDYPECQRWRA